jgi:hypothetical protein
VPSPKNRTARRCTRYVAVKGSLTVIGRAGNNSFRFTGSVNGARLAPGTYRLLAAPAGTSQPNAVKTVTFTIVR